MTSAIVTERHALLAGSVQTRAGRGGFYCQPEQTRRTTDDRTPHSATPE
jgi:hypothetical protein